MYISKRSGMDHTVSPANTPYLPFLRKRSPDGASPEVRDIQLQLTTYLSTPKGWKAELAWLLTCSGQFTHISGHPSATGRAQDRESSPAKDRRTTVPRNQLLRHNVKRLYREAPDTVRWVRPLYEVLSYQHQQSSLNIFKLKMYLFQQGRTPPGATVAFLWLCRRDTNVKTYFADTAEHWSQQRSYSSPSRSMNRPQGATSNKYMSVLLDVGSICTLAESHAAPWLVTINMPTGQADRPPDGRQTVTLRFPLWTRSVRVIKIGHLNKTDWAKKYVNSVDCCNFVHPSLRLLKLYLF